MEFNLIDDASSISGMKKTNDGYLVGTVNCARTGIQVYNRSDLKLDGAGTINVYRPEEAVFDADSLATYVGKPITLNHPQDGVNADSWKQHSVGHVGTKVVRNGDMVQVDIALMDADVIQSVVDGTREISMGYTTPVKLVDGVAPDGTPYEAVQTGPIRINHLAIVPQARGGDKLRVGDGLGANPWGVHPHSNFKVKDATTMKIIVDGITIDATEQSAQAIEKLQKQVSDLQTQIGTKDSELAAKDVELSDKDKAISDAKSAIPTGPVLDALVAERQSIIDAAKALAPDLKTDGLSNEDIKRQIVRKANDGASLDAKMAGKSDVYVDSYYDHAFDSLVATVAANDANESAARTAGNVASIRPSNLNDSQAMQDAAYQKTLDRFARK